MYSHSARSAPDLEFSASGKQPHVYGGQTDLNSDRISHLIWSFLHWGNNDASGGGDWIGWRLHLCKELQRPVCCWRSLKGQARLGGHNHGGCKATYIVILRLEHCWSTPGRMMSGSKWFHMPSSSYFETFPPASQQNLCCQRDRTYCAS